MLFEYPHIDTPSKDWTIVTSDTTQKNGWFHITLNDADVSKGVHYYALVTNESLQMKLGPYTVR